MTTAADVRVAAARQARRGRHALLLRRDGYHEVITVNDDFTDDLTDLRYLARTRHPLAMAGQEVKATDVRHLLDDGWGIRQRLTTDATRGVCVVWNRDLASAIGRAKDRPEKIGDGYLPLCPGVPGPDGMLTRGVIWQDLQLLTGERFRKASAHRPPARFRHLWPTFDDNLEQFLEASPLPVVLGTDNNEVGGPNVAPEWKWRGIRIDGFVSDAVIPSVYELAYRSSDHRPVSGALSLASLRDAA